MKKAARAVSPILGVMSAHLSDADYCMVELRALERLVSPTLYDQGRMDALRQVYGHCRAIAESEGR